MKMLRRVSTLLVIATLVLSTGLTGVSSAAGGQQSFKAEGTVTLTDLEPLTPYKEGFRIGPPVDPKGTGVYQAFNDDGSLDVIVDPNTVYWRWDAAKNKYVKDTYDHVVAVANFVKVTGKYTQLNNGNYVVTAKQVSVPPKDTTPRPANPQPMTVKDYNFNRHFNLVGSPTQSGGKVFFTGTYSDELAFVMGDFSFFNNTHVQAITQHHHDKATIHVLPTTSFKVQNPNTLKYEEASRDQAIVVGQEIRVVGKYGWIGNDWQFIANRVWRPSKLGGGGRIAFNEVSRQTNPGSQTSPGVVDGTRYDGETAAGDGQLDPGPFGLSLDWAFNPGTGEWDFYGSWIATNGGGFGTIEGTISGSYSTANSTITGTAILDSGTGRWEGVTGAGAVTGTGVGPIGNFGPPLTFDGGWVFQVYRT